MDVSPELNSYRLQAVIAYMALGDDPATATLYEDDTLLVTLPLVEPFGAVVDNTLVLVPSPEAMIIATGTANRCVFRNGVGVRAWTATVSDFEGEGEAKVEKTTLYAGGYTRLIGGVLA